ncbi:Crp/Fnr family transcriptional regulator [Olsenella sp. HMSC062G07]|uniref:Crp/Fnr family transcriptional regulator n=1 Tax=Olsenella sp. HMSC062G07 TaxID=1739330 RepID=UPI0008A5E4AD|nr:Crp/Fnr family transcriptional regulator [Olsenella sp. HMSC062G07]OFK23000.1 hypothetical protein HMPREF2826_00615 [Olsenella sp. HMSC062G07]
MDDVIMRALRRSSLFDGIDSGAFGETLEGLGATARTYSAGEFLICIGEQVRRAGIVLEGRIRIDFYDEAGNASTVANMGMGGTFGEAIACAEDSSIVQVEAVGDCRVLWLDMGRLTSQRTLAKSPCAGVVMMNTLRMLARKNMMLNRKMQMLAQKRMRDRIKLYLLVRDAGNATDNADKDMNRSDLARYLSVDRSALSRELSRMRDEGLVMLDGTQIKVLDRRFLEA